MVWSLPAIVLLGLTHLATCASINQSPELNPDENKILSENNANFPSLISTLNKRNGISRLGNGVLSFSSQNYPFRPADGPMDDVTSERLSSQNRNLAAAARDSLGWFNPLFLYGDPTDVGRNEETDDSSRLTSKSTAKETMDKPSNWKRRLQMQGPGLIGSKSGQRGLFGYKNSRNKGMVLSIDLGIKALRDAIYHSKVRQQNRRIQAQAQRNMKLLHNIGKRRAEPQEQF